MLTILTAPIRAIIGLMALIIMMLSAITLYLVVNNDAKRARMIEACQQSLSQVLLACLHVQVEYSGKAHSDARMFVANHISWLDALLFSPAPRLRFIAKSEVKDWPILGLLAQLLGTVFIRRENKFQVYRSLPNAQRHIQDGDILMVFPEGTTTVGETTGVFRPMLLEVAQRERVLVQPIAIRYWNHKQERSKAAPFIDDDGIFMNIMKLLFQRKTIAHVHFLPAMDPKDLDRKQMAAHSQHIILNALQQPYSKPQSAPSSCSPEQVKA